MALPRLFVFLMLLALLPLAIFGFVAYNIATNGLFEVEHQHVHAALATADLVMSNIQDDLSKVAAHYANWNDLHDRLTQSETDQTWLAANFGPASNIAALNNVTLLGIWNKMGSLVYGVGPVDETIKAINTQMTTTTTVADASMSMGMAGGSNTMAAFSTESSMNMTVSVPSGIYVISVSPIKDSSGADPNGTLLVAHKLGQADVDQLKQITGYDVALYWKTDLIATTNKALSDVQADELRNASAGMAVMDHSNMNAPMAFMPMQDDKGNELATIVILHNNASIGASQDNIAKTLAIAFLLTAALASVVARSLRNTIVRPITAMANSADQMAAGDLTQRVSAPTSTKELWRLANAFNRMAAKVGERVNESELARQKLEAIDEYRLGLLTMLTDALLRPAEQIEMHGQMLAGELHGSLNEIQKKSITAIRQATRMQEAYLMDLLDFSKAQKKRLKLAFKRIPLGTIVHDAYDGVKDRHASKRLQFEALIPPDLPMIVGDPTRMAQVMDRLLSFAFDQSIQNGRVQVTARALARQVEVSISDTSAGLSEDDRTRLFDAFYTPKADADSEAMSAYGVGLILAKTLLEEQKGTLELMVDPGKGNTFILTIPSVLSL